MARRIEVSVQIPAPIGAVWNDLARIETHAEWMTDAVAIEFLGERRQGVGTRIRVPTRIGPLTTVDYMSFTAWEPPNRMAIAHEGKFTGTGEFALRAKNAGTVLTWREEVRFPVVFGGRIGEWAAAPILRRAWRANLKRFARRFNGS
jgi:carbon monoxide dehydrogenase subunit G